MLRQHSQVTPAGRPHEKLRVALEDRRRTLLAIVAGFHGRRRALEGAALHLDQVQQLAEGGVIVAQAGSLQHALDVAPDVAWPNWTFRSTARAAVTAVGVPIS